MQPPHLFSCCVLNGAHKIIMGAFDQELGNAQRHAAWQKLSYWYTLHKWLSWHGILGIHVLKYFTAVKINKWRYHWHTKQAPISCVTSNKHFEATLNVDLMPCFMVSYGSYIGAVKQTDSTNSKPYDLFYTINLSDTCKYKLCYTFQSKTWPFSLLEYHEQ